MKLRRAERPWEFQKFVNNGDWRGAGTITRVVTRAYPRINDITKLLYIVDIIVYCGYYCILWIFITVLA